jgi:Zn-dependent metalloprotease
MQRKTMLTILTVLVMLLGMIPLVAAAQPNTTAPLIALAGPETVASAVQRLQQRADGNVIVSYRTATGVVNFIRMSKGGDLMPTVNGGALEAKSLAFLAEYGAAFGLTNISAQLRAAGSQTDIYGATHFSYEQVQNGVLVFGSFLKTHLDANGRLTAVNGTIVPNIKISTTPALSASSAGATAVAAVAGDVRILSSRALIYRQGLVQDTPNGADHLVYEVEVGNGSTIREFVYVDAFDGQIVDQISGTENNQETPDALSRQISESSLANIKWTNPPDPDPIPPGWAGGTVQQVTDWNDEASGSKESYNLFGSMAGRDSYNNAGAMMRTVNNDPGIACPNANWNGTSTNYCTGVTSDDVVSHEWGHAYTEYTSNLIYAWQPGAMNESYSDIWGETIDLINGRGTDTPGGPRASDGSACSTYGAGTPSTDATYRWLMGEDSSAFGGAIRDLWRPECYSDPGRVGSASYTCSTADGGGVHTNSGVPNHTYALLVDGGTYNGQTVTGLGLTKAAHIFWRAQSTYLGPASGFPDLANALAQSCTDLIGQNLNALSTSNPTPSPSGQIISAADCLEVADASAATQLTTPPTQCNFQPLLNPTAPALCSGGPVNTIWTEAFTSGLGTWTLSHNFPYITPIDWVVATPPTPSPGSGGQAAFAADPNTGNCSGSTGDNSGVMMMTSPVITIPGGITTARMTFNHWVATESRYDGGNLKISINGGAFTLVPQAAYTFNVPNTTLYTAGQGNTNPLAGQRAWTGSDGGSVSGSWGQTQLNLQAAGVLPGNTIQLRYDSGMDGCSGLFGWYVDDVNVYACEGFPTSVTLSNVNTAPPARPYDMLVVAVALLLVAGAVAWRRRVA